MRWQMFLAVLMVGICSRADALVLYAPKKGTGPVTVQTACEKNEVQLDPATLGLQGPPGLKGDKGDPGPRGPMGLQGLQGPAGPGAVVKDTNGTFVGLFLGFFVGENFFREAASEVLRSVGNTTFIFRASSQGFAPSLLYYQSTDCSGPVLLDVSGLTTSNGTSIPVSDFTSAAQILGTTFYYTTTPGVPIELHSFSIAPFDPLSSCNGGKVLIPPSTCCWTSGATNPFTLSVAPATTAELPTFVPPFHVEVQP